MCLRALLRRVLTSVNAVFVSIGITLQVGLEQWRRRKNSSVRKRTLAAAG
jgi:hypothetical protein